MSKKNQKIDSLLTKVYGNLIFPAICLVSQLEFKIALSQEDLDAVYHISWEIYGNERRYIDPNNYPNKRYSDQYDQYSVSFIAHLKGKPVGTLRLILDSKLGFYIERDFSIVPPPILRTEVAEISRFAVLKEYRGGLHLVSFGLLRAALKFSKLNGIRYWYALTGERLKDSLDHYGFEIKLLPYLDLTEDQIKERQSLESYYKNINPQPYLVILK